LRKAGDWRRPRIGDQLAISADNEVAHFFSLVLEVLTDDLGKGHHLEFASPLNGPFIERI
jgi:hypothetical protein